MSNPHSIIRATLDILTIITKSLQIILQLGMIIYACPVAGGRPAANPTREELAAASFISPMLTLLRSCLHAVLSSLDNAITIVAGRVHLDS